MWIKYCGFTRREDLLFASSLGIDAAGFIFYEHSKRYVTAQQVRSMSAGISGVMKTGIFVGKSSGEINRTAKEAGLDLLQLFADEAEADENYELPILRVYRIREASDLSAIPRTGQIFLLDAMSSKGKGGCGERFDWSLLDNFEQLPNAIIAGGVTLDNAAELVARKPYGVDLSSAIEDSPGIKSHDKMKKLFPALRPISDQ